MANVKKSDRVQNVDIKRLNGVGLGLKSIADRLGCHPATITLRMQEMGLVPTDTRRSFMEQVFDGLTTDQQEWLSHNLYNAEIWVGEFVTNLIRQAYAENPGTVSAAPVAVPELEGNHPQSTDILEELHGTGGVSEKPSPDQHVEPEKLENTPESKLTVPAKKPKLDFKAGKATTKS
jgi:hypothetical protein